jgi:hypothetical protein
MVITTSYTQKEGSTNKKQQFEKTDLWKRFCSNFAVKCAFVGQETHQQAHLHDKWYKCFISRAQILVPWIRYQVRMTFAL